MAAPTAADVKRGIAVIWENLQCPICLDLMHLPVSTKCDHQFCKFCMLKLLDRSKRKETSCPVCKMKVTKRSLQESPGFQRLVEGLQNLVQSYEFDTCTNYFTGLQQKRQESSVEIESRMEGSSAEKSISEVDEMEKSASVSSSVVAKEAFAKLMDIKDSRTPDSQRPPGSSCELSPASVKSPTITQDVTSQNEAGPDNSPPCPDKKPTKRSNKRTGLEPDRIGDKRQKKSLEKVSEWLLNIPACPDKQSQENDDGLPISLGCDSDKESTCSSTPTEVNMQANEKTEVSPAREMPARGLEKQVFGAVYRRNHKSTSNIVTRGLSPRRRIPAPSAYNIVEEDGKDVKRRVSRRKLSKLTPAEFIAKSSSNNKGEGVVSDKDNSAMRNLEEDDGQEKDSDSNNNGPSSCSEGNGKVVQDCPKENHDDQVEAIEESPSFEVPVKRQGRRSRAKKQDIWEGVDKDLREREDTRKGGNDLKRRTSRNSEGSKDGHLKECKTTRKSLDLVNAGAGTIDSLKNLVSKANMVETEVNIESYPSSLEVQSPEARNTRRSLRLQAFTAEVQGTRKRKRSTPAQKAADLETESCFSQLKGGDLNTNTVCADAHLGGISAGQFQSGENEQKMERKNGCVCNDDFEKIEAMQSGEEEPTSQCVSEKNIPGDRSVVSVIPDTVDQEKHTNPCQTAGSHSPLVAVAPDSVPLEKRQSPESPSVAVVAPPVAEVLPIALISAVQQASTETEGDINDSELDTELLMKTFKGTKRKCFHLGSPSSSHTKSKGGTWNGSREEKIQSQKQDLACQNDQHDSDLTNISCGDQLPPSNPCDLKPHGKLSTGCLSSFGNTSGVSVSLLRVKSLACATENQEDTFPKNSGTTQSSALSPNKVAKSSQDSVLPGNSGNLFSSQLFSSSPNEGKPQNLDEDGGKKQSGMGLSPDISKENQGNDLKVNTDVDSKIPDIPLGGVANTGLHNNLESSITPDDLLPGAVVSSMHHISEARDSHSMQEAEGKDVEILSQPCVRKKRKAQRLESSESEPSSQEDNLPSMAQIFGCHHLPSPPGERLPVKADFPNQDGHQLGEQGPKRGLDSVNLCGQTLIEIEPAPGGPFDQNGSSPEKEGLQETANREPVQDGILPLPPPPQGGDEWINSSQGSVDLFGTPEECEKGDVLCSNVGPSRDSSQYSSEIINTQQKAEMQQELRRLEKMMALVSEALQRKESEVPALASSHLDSVPEVTEVTECDNSRVCPVPDPGGPADQGTPQLLVKTAGRRSCRKSQRSSEEGCGRRSGASLRVKGCSSVSEGLNPECRSTPEVQEAKMEEERKRKNSVEGKHTSYTDGRTELVASGLSASELSTVKKFARKMHGTLSKEVTPGTTHIIIKTDGELVCERTLKYFQGIAGRKWVVSFLWVTESFKQGRVLHEGGFEVCGDVVNGPDHNGPRKARTARCDELLLRGYQICFQGCFTGMTTNQMEAMVEMCGATVVKDSLNFSNQDKYQLVVVQPSEDESESHYKDLQKSATMVTRGWLLDSIASYTLQDPENYKP